MRPERGTHFTVAFRGTSKKEKTRLRPLERKTMKILKRILLVLLCLALLLGAGTFVVNFYVKGSVKEYILSPQEAQTLEDVDCILVLGCGVYADGVPSNMLRDRLEQGIALYRAGVAPKLLMSGDHGQENYNEVSVMKNYAVESGVSSHDVFMDHAGFSTYESMYRAKEIFQAKRVVIVTQKYHLYRAIYVACALGLEAYGVAADTRAYAGQYRRDLREVLARCKDFLSAVFRPEPTFLGEAIPVSGDGDLTNDK